VADLLAATGALAGWRRWLWLDGDELPYRFALDGLRVGVWVLQKA